jgi:putative two-component system response regulator
MQLSPCVPDGDFPPLMNPLPVEKRPRNRVLIVDDLPQNLRLLRRLLEAPDMEVIEAADAVDAVAVTTNRAPDVILMDVRMPQRDGFDACRDLKTHPTTRLIPVVLMTAELEPADRLRAIEAGADDFVTKPLNPLELTARLRSLARVKRFTDDLEHAEQLIVSLAMTIEARDSYTQGHCRRLARYASAIGEEIGLSQDDIQTLQRGGYLHDLGKIAIPDSILLKPGRLSDDEVRIMQSHPVVGERLCGELRTLASVRPIIRSHHERLDGSGYPDGLAGDAVPLLAQITAIVDVFDALTTERPYRVALTQETALQQIELEVVRGLHQPMLFDAFRATLNPEASRRRRAR